MTNPTVTFGYKTHVGRVREINQDSYAALKRSELLNELDALLVIADGMGGGRGGDVASRIVAETLPNVTHEYIAERRGRLETQGIERMLQSAIARANANVYNRQVEQRELRGMGTTCVAAVLYQGALIIGNAGDSRAYLLRQGKLSQITADHSEVWEQVMKGNITREQARKHRYRNVITKAVGVSSDVVADVETLPLMSGDTVMLCSDGLTTEVNDEIIAQLLASAPTAQDACDLLVEKALRKGGSDNITVITLRYGDFEPIPLEVTDEEDEEEEVTDPTAEWRNIPPTSLEDLRPFDDEEDEEAETGRRSSSRLPLVFALILFCVALAEGIALYVAQTYRTVQVVEPRKSSVAVNTDDSELRTAKKLFYPEDPVVVYERPVRSDFLQADMTGDVFVLAPDGKPLRISAKGAVTKIAGVALPAPENPPRSAPLIAFDTAMNRYQTNAKTKSIVKYDPSGALLAEGIGNKQLVAPTRMVVTQNGDLYLLDEKRLKRIEAFETTEQLQRDNESKRQRGTRD